MASVKLSTKAVGSTVKLKVNGTLRDFIVVHQGKPSSIYDDSCNGTWLLMEDIYETRQWHSSNVNKLESSTIHSYLNSTFLGLFDDDIQSQIKQVKIPYRQNGGSGGTDRNGTNGLSCKIFLLSGKEVGWDSSDNQYFPNDGAKLDYFLDGTGTSANNKRIAYLNNSATSWWLRSPDTYLTYSVWVVGSLGSCNLDHASGSYGIRPALVLPSDLLVSDDGSVTTNTAPTTPGNITLPSTIKGGEQITISWGASTDTESNLEGYSLERSVDGGSSWVQVYQGAATSTTNTVPAGSSSVTYRVRAYDAQGLYSAYRTSEQKTVINNTAPGAPASITLPTEILGGSNVTVTWGAASDVDNNLEGYALERQVDGGGWTEVWRGNALNHTDAVTKGWASLAYRVRAYDAYTAYSGYTTSPTRTVNNNTPPVITCDNTSGSDLGTKSSGFTVDYSVDDAEENAVTVTESVDDTTKRTFAATLEAENTFDLTGEAFMQLLNGPHTLKVSANDGTATTEHTLTFTKSVTGASISLAEPMEADAAITVCVLSVIGSIPADAEYTVKVTNNANDTTPVWEDCTTAVKAGANYVFENDTAEEGFAFNFLLEVERGESNTGGYIVSIQGGFQ